MSPPPLRRCIGDCMIVLALFIGLVDPGLQVLESRGPDQAREKNIMVLVAPSIVRRSNSSLQRTVIDKVLARGPRQGDLAPPARWKRQRAAAELSR